MEDDKETAQKQKPQGKHMSPCTVLPVIPDFVCHVRSITLL